MTRTASIIRSPTLVSAVAVGILLLSVPIGAQQQEASEKPISFGFGLGAAARPGSGIGPLGLATLEFRTPWEHFDVRVDGMFASWSGITYPGRVTSLTTNLVYFRQIGAVAPYLIGGIGGYAQPGSGAVWGLNGGIGIKATVWKLKPFVELRQHAWAPGRTYRMTPLTFGLTF
jgi:hypothetical protein